MNALQGFRRSDRLGRLALLALIAFSVRAVVPAGFMPAALADGGPFVLCRDASAATLSLIASPMAVQPHDQAPTAASAHAHDSVHLHDSMPTSMAPGSSATDEHSTHASAWEHCPFAAGATAALVPFNDIPIPAVAPVRIQFPPAVQLRFAEPFNRYRARAPPA